MPKIRILDRGFPTTHYGYFSPGDEKEVSEQFATYCVNRMKAAEYIQPPKPKRRVVTTGKK